MWLQKLLLPPEAPIEPPPKDPWNTCRDCGAQHGELHDLFCTQEVCPFCEGQLISCRCKHSVLHLTKSESEIVDAYIDDSIEPLSSIMVRWKQALNERGRVPFHAEPKEMSADSLIRMAARGELSAVRELLADGLPVDATNEVGSTALMAAARNYRIDVLRFLLEAGASVNHCDIYGHTAAHCAVSSPSTTPEDQSICLQLILDRGADPNALDQNGGTPLMKAAWFGYEPRVDILLHAGVNPSLRNHRGRTAEDLAREKGHTQIAMRLTSERSENVELGPSD